MVKPILLTADISLRLLLLRHVSWVFNEGVTPLVPKAVVLLAKDEPYPELIEDLFCSLLKGCGRL
jgi:hypothetical protein